MDSTTAEVLYFFPSFLRVYTDACVERLAGTDVVPPSINSETGVSTMDVLIATETGVSARLFKSISVNPEKRLPLLVYFHGGGFSLCSPYCSMYHNYITSLVLACQIIAVSVDYRLALDVRIFHSLVSHSSLPPSFAPCFLAPCFPCFLAPCFLAPCSLFFRASI